MTVLRRNISFSVAFWLVVIAFATGFMAGHLLPKGHVPLDPVDAGK